MSLEVIAIVAVGIGLAALILAGQRSLSARMDRLEAQIERLEAQVKTMEAALRSISQRVARIEGAFPFLVRPFAAADPVKRHAKPEDE